MLTSDTAFRWRPDIYGRWAWEKLLPEFPGSAPAHGERRAQCGVPLVPTHPRAERVRCWLEGAQRTWLDTGYGAFLKTAELLGRGRRQTGLGCGVSPHQQCWKGVGKKDGPQGQKALEKPPGEAGTPGRRGTRGSLSLTDATLVSKREHWSQSGRRNISSK